MAVVAGVPLHRRRADGAASAPTPAAGLRWSNRTVRYHLAVLAGAVALPAVVFAGLLLWRFADAERARLEGQARSVASAAAHAVDQELAGLAALVETVSLFGSLQDGNLPAFHAQASAVRDRTGIDLVLRDASGQQLVNTRRPWGEPLPAAPTVSDAESVRTGRAVVSDVFTGMVAQSPVFAVTVPVRRGPAGGGGGAGYFLGLNVPVERVRRALAEEMASSGTPADWTMAVADRTGTVLARSRAHDEFVGKPITEGMRTAVRSGQEGVWRGATLDGQKVFGAFARSRLSGWPVAVGVPEDALAAPLRRALALLGTLGAALFAIAALVAVRLARRIADPIRALADSAAALGRGDAVAPLATPVGEVDRVAAALGDASAALKQREAALLGSERRLRAILDTVPVGVVIAEAPSGRIVEGNKQAERVFGHPVLPSPDVESYREWVSHHPDGRPVGVAEYPLSRVVRGGEERAELEVLYLRGDEREAWVRLVAAPVRDGDGRVAGGVVACLDIDREKRAEAALRRLNEELETRVAERTAERDRMWRLSTDLMLVARFEGIIEAANPAWTAALGWTDAELVGTDLFALLHPDDVAAARGGARALADGRTLRGIDNRCRHKDGSYRWLSWTAAPGAGRIHAVARDVTAEKAAQAALAEAEERLRQAQKMEAVGQLTGGVAHDFNNLLQVVMGSIDLLRRRAPPDADPRMRRSLDSAAEAARRGAALTARLLAFSRRQTLDPKPVDANKLVAGMSDLLRRSLGEAVRLETVLAGGLWGTRVDPNQLENAILNLAVNARDAMPDGGGRLTVETANTHLDERYARDHDDVPPGQYVMVAVSDTGSGMPPEVAARAFEPFFTTKEIGQGTGLGLSQVYGFVKQSGGHVKIYSEPGQGTTVKIYLPRLRDHAPAAAGTAEPDGAPLPALPAARGETVLVVEDDAGVRRFTAEALRDLGYRVLEADGAAPALEALGAHGDAVDLLFTDVVMPEVDGRRLAEEALRRHPRLKVLFTTGYSRNAIVHNGVLDPGVQLIGKPFTMEELAAKLRAVLDRPAPAPPPRPG